MATVTLTRLQHTPRDCSDELSDIDTSLFLPTWRPWLALYGAKIRPGGKRHADEEALAPIQALLPEELLLKVLGCLPMHSLAAACCVCQQWKRAGDTPTLWRKACLTAFAASSAQENAKLLKSQYRSSWRTMFLDRPHLRFDGLYVSRNTYIKRGIVEWRVKNASHLVCYYRYLHFMSDGRLLYRTSPEVVSKVAKSMADHPARKRRHDDPVFAGRYHMDGDKLYTKMVVNPASRSTEVRTRLRLRSTVRGANNRLDILSIVSYDRLDGQSVPMNMTGSFDEEEEVEGEARDHRRGMAVYVFVPWEQVNTSILNRSVEEMDVWLPG